CSARLTTTFIQSWVRASEEDAGVLARAIVRLAMSYVSMPPEADHDVARDLARLMTPFAERYGVIDTPYLSVRRCACPASPQAESFVGVLLCASHPLTNKRGST